MTLVVADTTPLRYFVEIRYEYLLPQFFTKVWIPGTVAAELRHERTPGVVGPWAERPERMLRASELAVSESRLRLSGWLPARGPSRSKRTARRSAQAGSGARVSKRRRNQTHQLSLSKSMGAVRWARREGASEAASAAQITVAATAAMVAASARPTP